MIKKSLKKCCLALFVSLFLTACGNSSDSGNTTREVNEESNPAGNDSMESEVRSVVQMPEWVYVPQILTIGTEDVDYDDIYLSDDTFCYLSRGGDVENAVRNICQYSISGQNLETIPIGWLEDVGNKEIGGYAFARDCSLYAIANVYSSGYSQMSRILCQFDPEGKQILSQDITEQVDRNMSVSGMAVDTQGRSYIFTYDSGIFLYEADGSFHGSITHDSSERTTLKDTTNGNDGNLYACFGKESDPDYCMLAKVDFEAGQIVEIDNTLSGIMGFSAGAAQDGDPAHQCDFLLYDDSHVYTYDMAAQKEYLTLAAVNPENSLETMAYRSFTTALDPEDSLVAMAVHFNKNNFQYHVTVKSYDSMNDLYNAILTGEPIDLISLSGLDVQKMYSQGIFEDLNPYLDQSGAFGRDDFLDGILDTYTFDGTLVSIPATLMLQTVVGNREQTGDKSGMTLKEFFTAVDQHPEALAFGEVTKEEMLQYLMMFNEETFIDWNTGECRFDSTEFKKLLEFVKQFPDVMEDSNQRPRSKLTGYQSCGAASCGVFDPRGIRQMDASASAWLIARGNKEEESLPTKIQNGKVMFAIADIYAISAIQSYGDMFHGNDVPIGFPAAYGKKGNLLITGDAFAVAAKSERKEAAWTFIEKELIHENERCYPDASLLPTYFPTLKEVFQTVMEDKIESNNQMTGHFPMRIYEDGWTFTFHAINWDEINAVLDLLKNARPASSAENNDIVKIIYEEAQAYYNGQKSVDDVADIIQNRVSLYVGEKM